MDPDDARRSLEQATSLSTTSTSAARWLVPYYVALGLGSVVLALGVGLTGDPVVVVVTTTLWVVLVVATSVYAATRRATVRGMAALHGVTMGAWTAAWCTTVLVGSLADLGWAWWAGGGLAMLAICLAAAASAHRRARPTPVAAGAAAGVR
ncbi:hypothetical protein RDV89_19790 [Nocardioides zeae]|uniref:Integral membrane protein n=1 Tax=Nocardioides imazamoxiresistens TaxID=3231893 RepID=A0ABU3Q1G1_9ACTN|nr:hypothetical protein [Nocardioides zeae]MDT9595340.1 hypothetical protein [Nocardioides zeae]